MNRLRIGLLALGCVLPPVGYVFARHAQLAPGPAKATSPPQTGEIHGQHQADFADLRRVPHIFYRSARKGEFGRIVIADLSDVEQRRHVTDLNCDRAHFDDKGGVCLTYDRDATVPNFRARVVDADLTPRKELPVAGFPSRTSLSRDGNYAAMTVFTSGDSYDSEFSTRTLIVERQSGAALPDLERFEVSIGAKPFRRIDFNFWGVTFIPDTSSFYVSLGTTGTTYLAKGNISNTTIDVVREHIECPSLSPDGRHLAFKRRNPARGLSELYTLNLQTGHESPVPGEHRHVDDQATWLDDEHVLYGMTTSGSPEQALTIWVASITPRETFPKVFVAGASSPSVVR